MGTLTNDLRYTLEVPCERGILGPKCTGDDYASWRRVAVGVRQTVVSKLLKGGFAGQNTRAISSWLLAWVGKDVAAKYGIVAQGLAYTRAATQADPDLSFQRSFWGVGTPVSTYAGRFPVEAPIDFQRGLDPASWVGATAPTLALVDYIREGYPFVKEALDAGTISPSDVAGEVTIAEERTPGVVNWVPLAITGAGIFAGVFVVAYIVSLFVRAKRGEVTVTAPLIEAAGTAAKFKGR